jgi:hypothetical protein
MRYALWSSQVGILQPERSNSISDSLGEKRVGRSMRPNSYREDLKQCILDTKLSKRSRSSDRDPPHLANGRSGTCRRAVYIFSALLPHFHLPSFLQLPKHQKMSMTTTYFLCGSAVLPKLEIEFRRVCRRTCSKRDTSEPMCWRARPPKLPFSSRM